jgi:hypothetical protein
MVALARNLDIPGSRFLTGLTAVFVARLYQAPATVRTSSVASIYLLGFGKLVRIDRLANRRQRRLSAQAEVVHSPGFNLDPILLLGIGILSGVTIVTLASDQRSTRNLPLRGCVQNGTALRLWQTLSCLVKTKELTRKQILSVPCPTCGAATEEACKLHTGALRTEPHRDRKLSAAEAVETKSAKR